MCDMFGLHPFLKEKNMFRMILINTCLAIVVTSCGGTFSYKRGARPEALTTAQTECKSIKKEDKKGMEKCLEAQGWSVYQFDDMDLFAEASESTEGMGGRATSSAFVTVEETETTVDTTLPTASNVVPEKAIPVKKPNTPQEASQPEKITVATKQRKASVNTTKKASPSLYKTYKVSSWWQWGAGQQVLEKDLATCENSLGKKHKPDFSRQLVTRGFVICMHKKGWKALKSK